MFRHIPIFCRRNPLTIILVSSCLLLLGIGALTSARMFASHASPEETKILVTNKTKSLQVVSVKTTSKPSMPAIVEVELMNQSNKNIGSLILTIGDSIIMDDYTSVGRAIVPGQTNIQRVALSSFEEVAAKDPDHVGEMKVSAIYFEDHTGEGDPRHIQMINDNHLGMRAQIQLVLPVLRNALNSSETDADKKLQLVESQASLLQTEAENNQLSPDYREGREWIKEELGVKIKTIKERKKTIPNYDVGRSLSDIHKSYERLLAKL